MQVLARIAAIVAVAIATTTLNAQTKPNLAPTPPMGWNSWNWFAEKVTDKDIRAAADLLVSSGMRDAGYVYVNIDDTWQGKRDENGVIHPNDKFPDMKALGDYVHAKGLKLGIYSSPGPLTCAKYEGSFGHEEQDAKTYAEWGVDFLKYDLCSYGKYMREQAPNDQDKQDKMMKDAWEKMHQAIVQSGRPMVYSLCQYGVDSVWEWGPQVGANMWRTTGDITSSYDRIVLLALMQTGLAKFAGPGHWNDPDMLEVGNGKLSHDENVAHMTMWAMLAAPLLAGNNLTQMNDDVKQILTNRGVIAIDQDPLGRQGEPIYVEGPVQIWVRPLADGSKAFAIFNIANDRAQMRGMRLHLSEAGYPNGAHAYDVWTGKDLGKIEDGDGMPIPKRGAILLRLTK
jgi:alpha-galactosidase